MTARIFIVAIAASRAFVAAAAVGLPVLAAGCANPIPQYLSPRDEASSIVTSALVQQRDGGCPGLGKASAGLKADLARANAKAADDLKRPAASVSRAWQRAFGPPGSGTEAYDEARSLEARIAVLDREMAARNCPADASAAAAEPAGAKPAAVAAAPSSWTAATSASAR